MCLGSAEKGRMEGGREGEADGQKGDKNFSSY